MPDEADALAEHLLAQGLNVQNVSAEPLSGQVLSGQSADRIFATLRGKRSSRMAGAGIFADMPTDRMMATRDAVLESWQDMAREGSARLHLHIKEAVFNTSGGWRTMLGQASSDSCHRALAGLSSHRIARRAATESAARQKQLGGHRRAAFRSP